MAKPSDYERRSELIRVDSLSPELRASLEEFAAKVGADLDLRAVTAAVRTTGVPRGKGGLFRKASPLVEQHALITDRYLAIATLRAGDQINSIYRLDSIDVSDFQVTFVEDVGLEITGTMLGMTERGTAFFGLDQSPAGRSFREQLMAAARPAAR